MQVTEKGFTPALSLKPEFPKLRRGFEELGGYETSTSDGTCWTFETITHLPDFSLDENLVREKLLREVTLVKGIGQKREKLLKRKNIRTIQELKNPEWKSDAKEVAEIILSGSKKEIVTLFQSRGRGADPLLTGLGAACPKEELLFYDIETLGMTHSPIILFGCGICEGDKLITTQYLLRDIGEEIAALLLIADLFQRHPVAVTYNGRAFDIPYTNNRLAFYGEREVMPNLHVDLLHSSRRLFKHELPDCCLGTVENYILHTPRSDDLPGYLVPIYYQRYLETRDPMPLEKIVSHNRSDVTSLSLLLARQTEMVYGA